MPSGNVILFVLISATVLFLAQGPLTVEQIHVEDSKVIETALLGYWAKNRSESETIYVPSRTAGPVRPDYDRIIDGKFEKRLIVVGDDLRENYLARNAYPIDLNWFHPKDKSLRVVSKDSWKKRGELRQYSWMLLPGYDKERSHALVCFGFNWSMHSGEVTVLLAKADEGWKVTDIRDIYDL